MAAAAAAGRAPPTPRRRRRGRGWSKSPRRPRPPSPSPGPGSSSSPAADPPTPLPPGAEVEVRVDEDGFGGSWYEATVVDFAPARGPRTPARYTVTYAHLLADEDGGVLAETFAATHIRPRPPPASDSFPPRFHAYDIVEAFHNDGWWSGIVLTAPDTPDTGASVTVAFPLTREVIRFLPRLVRPRRDYVDGGWVPSRAAMVVRPRRALKAYTVGEKVEVKRDRPVYGQSWFAATVARVVDDLSYVVEYFDLEEEGDDGLEKATEYLHWSFIRPAVEHVPPESEFRLGPGAAVEAYCDGAWSPGVVRGVVGEAEFEVCISGKKAELVVTRVVELLKPQYKWNGKQWKIVIAKRRANLRRQSMPGQNSSTPVDVLSSDDEYRHDPESSGIKKSRKKLQQRDALLAESSVSEMDTPLCKLTESNHSGSQLSEKNSLQAPSHVILSSAPMNGLRSDDEYRRDPESSGIKKSRKKLQQRDALLAENSVSEMDTPLCKLTESNHSGSQLSEKNSLQAPSHVILSSAPMNGLRSDDEYRRDPESSGIKKSRKKLQQRDALLAESSVSEMGTPLCKLTESNHSGSQLSEKDSLQAPSHVILSSAPMNGLLCASGHSTPQNESVPNSTVESVENQETQSEMMDSDGQLDTHVYGATAGDAHDMLSIAELRKKMASSRRNAVQKTQKKVISVKALKVKKGISKSKGGKTHPIQELQRENDASDNIQLKGNINFSSKDIVCALSVSVEGQTTKTQDRRVTRWSNRGSRTKLLTYKKLARRKGPRELCSPHSSLDVTCTVQQRGRKKVAGPMKESPLAEQLDNTSEDVLNIELPDQDLLPRIPPGFESMYDGKGVDLPGSLPEEEPAAMIDSISQANICTNHAATQVDKGNHLMETAIPSVDHPVQEAGGKVVQKSILRRHQITGSSKCAMVNSPSRTCFASGSSMPEPLPVYLGHQVLFVKKSDMWPKIEASYAFKELPQQPHFLPLREFSPALREGMALGLMVTFVELVNSTSEASIDQSTEWFEDKITTLCHLEGNGFNVHFLQSTLTKLLDIKSNCTSYLGEVHKLDAQIVGETASSSQIDALLSEKDRVIAELEKELGRLRQESQKVAKDREHQEAELFRLQAARSTYAEAYGDAKRQFDNVLAELHRKRIT